MKKKDDGLAIEFTKDDPQGAVGAARDEAGHESMMQPFHVLLVDDDSLVRDMLKMALESLDVFVTVAENGLQAQKEILAGNFRLVITDINMPGMNGADLLRWLRQQRPHIEGIVITGREISESVRQELKKGVIDFLFKPFPLDRLREAVKKSMERLTNRDNSEYG